MVATMGRGMAKGHVKGIRLPSQWCIVGALVLLGLATFVPLAFVFVTSFKDNTQFFHHFWTPTWPLHLENYSEAVRQLLPYILNSLFYSAATVAIVVLLTSISGFVFARYRFAGKQAIFLGFISLMMVPGILTLAPRFVLVQNLGLLNNPLAVILPWSSTSLALGTWLMRTHFESIPREIFEAVRIDGGSEIDALRYIAVPISLPMVATVAIWTLLLTWEDLIWPLVTMTDQTRMPLLVGLLGFSSSFQTQWGALFAGYVISALPLLIVFVLTSRYFVAGLTSGAGKL